MDQPRSVTDWFRIVTDEDDLTVIRQALAELDGCDWPLIEGPRLQHLLHLLIAIRMHQMVLENSA